MLIAFELWVCASRPVKALHVLLDEEGALIAMLREELLAGWRHDV